MDFVALLFAVSALPWGGSSLAPPVTSAEEACAAVKADIIAREPRSEPAIAFCDIIPEAVGAKGYFVMALHSNRQCDGICSTNMGWFAVAKATGQVFDWDVAEWRLGQQTRRER